jgi:hypothetical protein
MREGVCTCFHGCHAKCAAAAIKILLKIQNKNCKTSIFLWFFEIPNSKILGGATKSRVLLKFGIGFWILGPEVQFLA